MNLKVIFPSFMFAMLLIISSITIDVTDAEGQSQEPIFELPVQLVGFPVIILAVRFSNFVKKLAYSVNPKTYQSRSRRSPIDHLDNVGSAIDVTDAEKRIVDELGPKACILEEPCIEHALRGGPRGEQPDWNDILKNYKVQRPGMKQWYLLSVFMGDVIRDTSLCKRLSKRLQCDRSIQKLFSRH